MKNLFRPLLVLTGCIVLASCVSPVSYTHLESVTVLKDAASSAIYGARAAFGVIFITTKKGSDATKLSINYSRCV